MAAPKGNKNAVGNEGGRPTLYKDAYAEQAYKLCLLGATDAEIADFFEVSEDTINNWKKQFVEFFESLKKGKTIADANIADRLYQRAMGYEHTEDKIFQFQGEPIIVPTVNHYPPDTTAAIFWLKNRQKGKWRDKTETDLTSGGKSLVSDIDYDQLSDAALIEIAKAKKVKADAE